MSNGIVEASGKLIVTGALVGGAAGVGVAGPVGAVIGGAVGAAGAVGLMAVVATSLAIGEMIEKIRK